MVLKLNEPLMLASLGLIVPLCLNIAIVLILFFPIDSQLYSIFIYD